ncbi:MAG: DUF5106 domain-containing protein, partial [Bacteroidia bacterium]|nr:DUF5106 domain-containing protein [Bacteroidia bacterium]
EHELDWVNVWDPYYVTKFKVLYDVYHTPEIYILNEKNIIVARRVEAEQLEKTLNLLLKN